MDNFFSNWKLTLLILGILVGISLLIWAYLAPKKEHYTTGEVRKKYHLKIGAKNGLEKAYYRNGALNRSLEWLAGKKHGVSTTYYQSGEVYIIASYLNDQLDGNYTVHKKDGTVRHTFIYKEGVMVK